MTQLDEVWSVKRAGDFTSGDQRQTFNTLKVSVLDRQDAFLGEKGFRVVVDELAVDEAIYAVGGNSVYFGLHFILNDDN